MKPTWCTLYSSRGFYNGTKSVARGAMFWEDLNVINKQNNIEMKLEMGLKVGDQDIQILWRHVIVLTDGFFKMIF